uniref:Candidate effector 13 n=1 Tax=Venturia inaequalis TaxID=5025 RepID=C0KM07_VENIN|nr:candidate effector 13 [Venturia inaequalis]
MRFVRAAFQHSLFSFFVFLLRGLGWVVHADGWMAWVDVFAHWVHRCHRMVGWLGVDGRACLVKGSTLL